VRTFFRLGGGDVLQMQTSALFSAKNFEFLEIYGVSTWTRGGGLGHYGHFVGERVNFSRCCMEVFYGRPLGLKCME